MRLRFNITQQHAGLRHLGQQPHHFVAARKMLVEITETGAQILHIGLVIE